MKNLPLISVVIPAHNSSRTIGTAIQNILDQTYPNIEIIVVDDNSADGTGEVVRALGRKHANIFYHALPFDDPHRFSKTGRNINAGWMARNYGLDRVRGEWITFQDADDASLLNRLETEYALAQRFKADHVSIDWQKLDQTLLGRKLDYERILSEHPEAVTGPAELSALARKSRGLFMVAGLHHLIPFEWKQARVINKLFFRSLTPFPGASNSPLFKREILKKVRFRPRDRRIWPTFVGRGADRDFNFQIALTFGRSYAFRLPLYLWRQEKQNPAYENYAQYLQNR